MNTQILTAKELIDERPLMTQDIMDIIMADTVATICTTEDSYKHLQNLFVRSGEDIIINYTQVVYPLDTFSELEALNELVEKVIENIGCELWLDMWDADEKAALSEVMRCFGAGISFWDSYNPEFLNLSEASKPKTLMEQPWEIAYNILEKIELDITSEN